MIPPVKRKDYELLDFLTRFMEVNKTSPTLQEIASAFKLTRAGAQYRLRRLMAMKIVQRDPDTLSIQLLKHPGEVQDVFVKKANLPSYADKL